VTRASFESVYLTRLPLRAEMLPPARAARKFEGERRGLPRSGAEEDPAMIAGEPHLVTVAGSFRASPLYVACHPKVPADGAAMGADE